MIYLSQEDVIRCGGMSMDKAVDDLEEVFRLYDKGDYILPGKIVMKRPEPNAEETTGRINAMPGYIGGRFNMPGIKWDRQRSAESVQVRPAARLGRDRAERSRDRGTHCHHGRHTHQCDPHRRSNGRLRQVYGALALEDRRPFRRGPACKTQLMALKASLPQLEKAYVYDLSRESGKICGGDVAKAEHGRAGGERPPRHDRKRRHPCDRDDRDRADHPRARRSKRAFTLLTLATTRSTRS